MKPNRENFIRLEDVEKEKKLIELPTGTIEKIDKKVGKQKASRFIRESIYDKLYEPKAK